MVKKFDEEIARIEQTQGALRESIEQTKELAEQAEKLLQKHKATLKKKAASD